MLGHISRGVAAAVLGVFVLAGCRSDASEPEVTIETFAQVLVESVWAGDQSFAIETAIAECMRESGFEVVVEPRPEPDQPSTTPPLPDQDYVARYGYGVVEQPPEVVEDVPSLEENPFQRAYTNLSEQQQTAFALAYGGSEDPAAGIPGRGCRGAVLEMIEEPKTQSRLAETARLVEDYQHRVASDERVVQARAEWTNCMAGAGFPGMVDSMSVFNDLFMRLQEPGADREEVRKLELTMAAADFGCLQQTFEATSVVEAELAPQFAEEAAQLLLGG